MWMADFIDIVTFYSLRSDQKKVVIFLDSQFFKIYNYTEKSQEVWWKFYSKSSLCRISQCKFPMPDASTHNASFTMYSILYR